MRGAAWASLSRVVSRSPPQGASAFQPQRDLPVRRCWWQVLPEASQHPRNVTRPLFGLQL